MSTQQDLRVKAHQRLIEMTNHLEELKAFNTPSYALDIASVLRDEINTLWKIVDEATEASTPVEKLESVISDLEDEQNARYLSAIQILDLILTDLKTRDTDGSPQFPTSSLDSLVEIVTKRAVEVILQHEAFSLQRDWTNRPYVAFADPGARVATLVTAAHDSEASHDINIVQGEEHVSLHISSVRKLMPFLVNFTRTGYLEYETPEERKKAFSED